MTPSGGTESKIEAADGFGASPVKSSDGENSQTPSATSDRVETPPVKVKKKKTPQSKTAQTAVSQAEIPQSVLPKTTYSSVVDSTYVAKPFVPKIDFQNPGTPIAIEIAPISAAVKQMIQDLPNYQKHGQNQPFKKIGASCVLSVKAVQNGYLLALSKKGKSSESLQEVTLMTTDIDAQKPAFVEGMNVIQSAATKSDCAGVR